MDHANGASNSGPVEQQQLRAAFGGRVRELHRERGLSQEKLAERAGVHMTYISGIERGQRSSSLVNIGRIAEALGVPTADLFPES